MRGRLSGGGAPSAKESGNQRRAAYAAFQIRPPSGTQSREGVDRSATPLLRGSRLSIAGARGAICMRVESSFAVW